MALRVLQFSDIHFSSRRGNLTHVHGDVREQVLVDLQTLGTTNVDAILIAGDVAFAGTRAEYQQAATWVERVRAACGCPRNSVLTVPGNHDVDRGRIKTSTRLVHRSLRSSALPQAAQEIAALAEAGDPSLLDKLSEYQAFAASYGCSFRSPSNPTWTRSYRLAERRTLSFIGLTTVQVCDDEDIKEGMLLGSHQFTIPRNPGVEQVVVMHHPLDWLKDKRQATDYLTSRARVLIVGHEHIQDLQKVTTPSGGERLLIASGALTPPETGEGYAYRYNILEFDTPAGSPAALQVTVYPRIWSSNHTAFKADYDCLDGGDSATLSLRCPMFDALGPVDPPSHDTQPLDEQLCRLRSAFWHRLAWQERIRVLTTATVLPPAPETPLPHALEEEALRNAQTNGKLELLWDTVMAQLPAEEREPNPFTQI